MEVRLKSIQNQKSELFRWVVSNGTGLAGKHIQLNGKIANETLRFFSFIFLFFPVMFTANSKHFISLTCNERVTSLFISVKSIWSSFHATEFAQRNSKRQVKIAIEDFASLLVLVACWKQLKLKNYTRRLPILNGHKSADVQCSHRITSQDKHDSRVFRYYCNYFDWIAEKKNPFNLCEKRRSKKKREKKVKFLFGNGKWTKVENRIASSFKCRLFCKWCVSHILPATKFAWEFVYAPISFACRCKSWVLSLKSITLLICHYNEMMKAFVDWTLNQLGRKHCRRNIKFEVGS